MDGWYRRKVDPVLSHPLALPDVVNSTIKQSEDTVVDRVGRYHSMYDFIACLLSSSIRLHFSVSVS